MTHAAVDRDSESESAEETPSEAYDDESDEDEDAEGSPEAEDDSDDASTSTRNKKPRKSLIRRQHLAPGLDGFDSDSAVRFSSRSGQRLPNYNEDQLAADVTESDEEDEDEDGSQAGNAAEGAIER